MPPDEDFPALPSNTEGILKAKLPNDQPLEGNPSHPSASAYHLPAIPYLKLRFALSAQQQAHLPPFKGSLLRGAFGHALRRTVCVMGPQQPCDTCMLRRQCVYPKLFETFVEGEPPRFLRGLDTAPRPYVFEPFDMQLDYRPGDLLQFDLILLGQAIELHPYAIFAVSQMAEQGLGFRRIPFRLVSCKWHEARGKSQWASENLQVANENSQLASDQATESEWRLLYDGATQRLIENPVPQLPATQLADRHLPLAPCSLRFITPTRLKFKNDLTIDFTFRMLVFKMLRRVLELAHFHVPGASIDWEFHSLLVAANSVKIVNRNLRWVDWERRSNRQKTEMLMGGFVGEMILEGDLSPFEHLLRTCEVLHVGKGCVFGNGKMVCEFGVREESNLTPR